MPSSVKSLTLVLCFSFVPLLFADKVVLKNGDTLTGSIVKKDGGKLTLKSELVGTVSIPWTVVTGLKSDEPVTVVLPGGETVFGKVATAGGNLEVTTSQGQKVAPLTTVDSIRNPAEQRTWERLQHPGLLELWTGFLDAGFSLARGNARTDTLTTAFNATRLTRKDKVALTFNQIYGTARVKGNTSTIASAVRGGWSYNRDINPRVFVSTLNEYEHDGFQNLDLRFVAGAGFGLNVFKVPKTNLSFAGGGDYSRENFSEHPRRDSAETNFGNDFVYHFSSASNLTQSSRFFLNLSDTGQYRANFDLGGVTALMKWLSWHVTASDRFLSNPLPGRQRNDLIVSTGFRVSFAR